MIKTRCNRLILIALVLLIGSLTSSCVATSPQADKGEQIQANIAYDLPESAAVTKVSYFYADYKGQQRLHFEVDLKNLTQEPKRFRVNILLPEGPAVGGMYPRKKKAIEPGKTLTRKFPVYIDSKKLPQDFLPSGFTILVKEL